MGLVVRKRDLRPRLALHGSRTNCHCGGPRAIRQGGVEQHGGGRALARRERRAEFEGERPGGHAAGAVREFHVTGEIECPSPGVLDRRLDARTAGFVTCGHEGLDLEARRGFATRSDGQVDADADAARRRNAGAFRACFGPDNAIALAVRRAGGNDDCQCRLHSLARPQCQRRRIDLRPRSKLVGEPPVGELELAARHRGGRGIHGQGQIVAGLV